MSAVGKTVEYEQFSASVW